MTITKRPQVGTEAHRAWLIECILETAKRVGVAPDKVLRIQIEAARTDDDRFWPHWEDWRAVGGWGAFSFEVRPALRELAGKAGSMAQAVAAAPVTSPAAAKAEPEDRGSVRLEKHRLLEKLAELKAENDALVRRLDLSERRNHVFDAAFDTLPPDLGIFRRERTSMLREATAVALASDWHVEETVDPGTIVDVNGYDLAVAEARAEKFFDAITWLVDYHRSGFQIRDLVLWLGGDLISGYIHEELVEGNALSPIHASRFARSLIIRGIRYLLAESELENILVVCNHGNHGRTTTKKRIQTGAENSYEHLLYLTLRDDFRDEPRVKFAIARGAHLFVPIYDFTAHFHHGDDVKFWGGVGGLEVPLNKALEKWRTVRRFDWSNIGHFHQYKGLLDKQINGSLIGYNPFAMAVKAAFEPPRQAFYLVDSKHAICQSTPLWVAGDPGQDPRVDPSRSRDIRDKLFE